MSRFDSIMTGAGLLTSMGQHGQTVTYTGPGEFDSAVSLTAMVDDGSSAQVEGEDREMHERRCRVIVNTDTSSEYGGVADPAVNAKISIDGEVWAVMSVNTKLPGSLVELECQRGGQMARSRFGGG